jgi:hypothetical protein
MPSVCIVSGQIQNEAGVFVLCVLCRYQELRVRSTALLKPEYSESFRCIGPACEDSCCEEWTIHVDRVHIREVPGPARRTTAHDCGREHSADIGGNKRKGWFGSVGLRPDPHECGSQLSSALRRRALPNAIRTRRGISIPHVRDLSSYCFVDRRLDGKKRSPSLALRPHDLYFCARSWL